MINSLKCAGCVNILLNGFYHKDLTIGYFFWDTVQICFNSAALVNTNICYSSCTNISTHKLTHSTAKWCINDFSIQSVLIKVTTAMINQLHRPLILNTKHPTSTHTTQKCKHAHNISASQTEETRYSLHTTTKPCCWGKWWRWSAGWTGLRRCRWLRPWIRQRLSVLFSLRLASAWFSRTCPSLTDHLLTPQHCHCWSTNPSNENVPQCKAVQLHCLDKNWFQLNFYNLLKSRQFCLKFETCKF